MGKLLIVVLAAALVWSGYWFVGARALDRAFEAGIADLREVGWQIDYADRRLRGFPNRFDTTFDEAQIRSPGGTGAAMPFFQLLALAYKPNEIIAVFPPEFAVESPLGSAFVTDSRARGSVTFETSTDLPLDHSSFVLESVTAESGGQRARAERVLLASRRPDGAPDASHQNIGLEIDDLSLPEALMAQFGARDAGPIERLYLDATLQLDAPIDRHVAEVRPNLLSADLHDVTLDWGTLSMEGDGAVAVGADGRLTGEILLKIADWRAMLGLFVGAGLLPANQRQTVEFALSMVAGGPSLTIPLIFEGGMTRLGPVPIGPAPRLR